MTTKSLFTLFLFLTMSSVASATDYVINWQVQDYNDRTAKVGDTVTFNWIYVHNVYIHPTMNCLATDRIEVGRSSGATYEFMEDDVGKDIYFVCDSGSHCENGQHVTFTVEEDESPNPTAATDAPSASPTHTCGSVIGKWGKIKQFCNKAGQVDDGDDSTNTFWEVSDDKKEVKKQECATDPCQPSECCVVGRHRTCKNTNHKGKESKFPNKKCQQGWKFDPAKKNNACTKKGGSKCKSDDCCKEKE